ncbi:MAG TPA: hypothetical protein VHA14_09055 [Bryobacteraceae bacterium]|nr:hypothetical protein [Bryobacteraceae bacterium]
MTSHAEGEIAAVLAALRDARGLLADPAPANIDRCCSALAQGVSVMRSLLAQNAAPAGGGIQPSLHLVRAETAAISNLLDSAAAFRRNVLRAISGTSLH